MSDHSVNLQKAVFDKLDQDGTLQGLVTDVYDFVPETTVFPYVKIGVGTSVDNGTKTLKGSDFTLEVSSFSRYRGSKEAKEIMSRVYDLLHEASLSVTGASLVFIRFEFSDVIKENDGLTTHGFQRFRALVNDS